MEDNTISLPHTLYIDNRSKLTLTGVTDVGSFNEEMLQIVTSLGDVTITGINLQVTKLSLESGEVTVEGKIISVSYTENARKSEGFFARMFS